MAAPPPPPPWAETLPAPDLSQERIFITGATGFVADAILDSLLERHPDIHVVASDLRPASSWARPSVPYIQADICAASTVEKAIAEAKPTVVIHTAGVVPGGARRYNGGDRETVFEVNVQGTLNMLQAAKSHGVKRFVYTSSYCLVTDDMKNEYPNMDEELPTGLADLSYGQSKGVAERPVLAANCPEFLTCAIRPSTITGPRDYQLLPSIHACIAKGETPFIIGTGENLYDFSYVGNIADAHVLALENLCTTQTAAGEAFFISNQEPVPFRDFMLAIWAEFGHVPPFEVRIPTGLAWFAGLMAEVATWFTGREATLSRGSILDATGIRYSTGDKARKILGFYPRVGLAEGIRISAQAYQKRLEKRADPADQSLLGATLKRIKSPYWIA